MDAAGSQTSEPGPERAMVDSIRDIAAELFTTKGYTATSTREIALRAGIKQASLYYYFPNKQAILESLMLETVHAPLLMLERLRSHRCSPVVRLHAMATYDVQQLADDRWNLGALYLLPELRHLPNFTQFFTLNEQLRLEYSELCRAARSAAGLGADDSRSSLPYRIIETVTRMRVDGEHVDVQLIADAVVSILELAPLTDAEKAESSHLAQVRPSDDTPT